MRSTRRGGRDDAVGAIAVALAIVATGASCATSAAERRAEARAERSERRRERAAELPSWARSIEARGNSTAVRAAPDANASERRGELAAGARFPIGERAFGPGCGDRPWYRIGERAWVCAVGVALSRAAPSARAYPPLARDGLLPFRYAFSRANGTPAFRSREDVERGAHVAELGARWGVAVVARARAGRAPVARTTRGTWVAERHLVWAEPSRFAGARVRESDASSSTLPIAWVRRGGAPVHAAADDADVSGRLPARQMVHVRGEVTVGSRTLARLADGRFVEARRLVRPARIAPPDGVSADERWIDVDLARQTLVAYDGATPVFATLVSTGRRPGSTPPGVHRIRLKLGHATMDDIDLDDPGNSYSMDAVPWIQYFADDVALHGVYWHDRFGQPSSHGCVNLAPRDARWLYAFTRPYVPDGWSIVRSTSRHPGTAVHVH
ncbi:MAG: L,D-transpeptidase [Deltaproteobacteria bacterium]|nr:L,D-transpeptidase [Deltaproteobacteria bacterium]